jgi:hypothetical protein
VERAWIDDRDVHPLGIRRLVGVVARPLRGSRAEPRGLQGRDGGQCVRLRTVRPSTDSKSLGAARRIREGRPADGIDARLVAGCAQPLGGVLRPLLCTQFGHRGLPRQRVDRRRVDRHRPERRRRRLQHADLDRHARGDRFARPLPA